VDLNTSQLDAAVTTAVPGFTDKVTGISGDFDENDLTDEAMILSSGSEWRLAVLLQQPDGRYDVTRLSAFPGSDDDWYTIPTSQLKMFLVSSDESPTDRIRLVVLEQPHSLEFFWHNKTGSFIASRVHNETATQQPDSATSQIRGEIFLHAMDSNGDSQQVSDIDLDQQAGINSANADLRFTVRGGSMIFYTLDTIDRAIAIPYGKTPPTYNDCLGVVTIGCTLC